MSLFFFFNDTATTEIYTLSLHDAFRSRGQNLRARGRRPQALHQRVGEDHRSPARHGGARGGPRRVGGREDLPGGGDRKSTRLNSSHANISYAVFCLKKKTY